MKAVLLAFVFTLLWIALQAVLFNLFEARHRSKWMLYSFVPTLPLLAWVYRVSPKQLGCLPAAWSQTANPVGIFTATVLYIVLALTWYQVYFYIDRPITFRMFIEIFKAPGQRLTRSQLDQVYSLEFMVQKRFDDMIRNGLVQCTDGLCQLTPKGQSLASVFNFSKVLFGVKS